MSAWGRCSRAGPALRQMQEVCHPVQSVPLNLPRTRYFPCSEIPVTGDLCCLSVGEGWPRLPLNFRGDEGKARHGSLPGKCLQQPHPMSWLDAICKHLSRHCMGKECYTSTTHWKTVMVFYLQWLELLFLLIVVKGHVPISLTAVKHEDVTLVIHALSQLHSHVQVQDYQSKLLLTGPCYLRGLLWPWSINWMWCLLQTWI